jgi:hypothetical protein
VDLVPAITRSQWTWTHTYLTGPEMTAGRAGFRHFHDSALMFTPRPWISSYFEALDSSKRWSTGGSDF